MQATLMTAMDEDIKDCQDQKQACSNDCEDMNDSDTELCPLFMTTLPTNFASNAALSALASMLDDDDDTSSSRQEGAGDELDVGSSFSTVPSASGLAITNCATEKRKGTQRGGREKQRVAKSTTNREQRRYRQPKDDSIRKKKSGQQRPGVGEAQLFLHMWKLSD